MSSRSKLPEDAIGFFRRVSTELDNEDEDSAISEEFLANIFDYIFKNNQLKLARDKVVCCILEKVLRVAPAIHVHAFLVNTVEVLDRYVSDKYASHVIQTAITQCLRMPRSQMSEVIEPEAEEDEDEDKEREDSASSLNTVVVTISKGIVGKLNDFAFDTYGSHVVCALIQVLSGVRVGDDIVRSRVSQKVAQKKTGAGREKSAALGGSATEVVWSELAEELGAELDDLCTAFAKMRDFSHCLTDRSGSKVLQALLYCTRRRDEKRCKHLCRQVLVACKVLSAQEDGEAGGVAAMAACNTGGSSAIMRLAEDSVASHGLECVLKVASPKLVQRLCQQCFGEQMLPMALHHSANYVVQKLCDALTTDNQMQLVAGELLPNLEDVLAVCHFGVCTSLVKASARLACQQTEVMEALMVAFHVSDEPNRCCIAFLAMSALDALDAVPTESTAETAEGADAAPAAATNTGTTVRKSLEVCPQGIQLVTALLGLAEPTPLLDSLLALTTDQLFRLATEQSAGSRIFDAFFECVGVDNKRKRKLVKKLKGRLVQLACHKMGSYVVDACYRNSKAKSRQEIAKELLQEEQTLKDSFFGKHVFRNCELHDHKFNTVQLPAKQVNKKRLFSDILDESEQEDDGALKKKSKKAKAS